MGKNMHLHNCMVWMSPWQQSSGTSQEAQGRGHCDRNNSSKDRMEIRWRTDLIYKWDISPTTRLYFMTRLHRSLITYWSSIELSGYRVTFDDNRVVLIGVLVPFLVPQWILWVRHGRCSHSSLINYWWLNLHHESPAWERWRRMVSRESAAFPGNTSS